jgi:hypothetical protein
VLEEKAARYMGVTAADRVVLTLDNVDAAVTEHQVQVHPQKPEMGMRVMLRSNKVRRRAICKCLQCALAAIQRMLRCCLLATFSVHTIVEI